MELKTNQKIIFSWGTFHKPAFTGKVLTTNKHGEVFVKIPINARMELMTLDLDEDKIDKELSIIAVPISKLIEKEEQVVYIIGG